MCVCSRESHGNTNGFMECSSLLCAARGQMDCQLRCSKALNTAGKKSPDGKENKTEVDEMADRGRGANISQPGIPT